MFRFYMYVLLPLTLNRIVSEKTDLMNEPNNALDLKHYSGVRLFKKLNRITTAADIDFQADVVNKIKCKDVVKFNRSLAN